MSTWIDKKTGGRHGAVILGGQRLHRICPENATASDAKQLEADLRPSLTATAAAAAASTSADPALTDIIIPYVQHADTLRWPAPAKLRAARIVPWLQNHNASEARLVVAKIIRDMRPPYEAATINRSLAALKTGLSLAFDAGLTSINHGLAVKSLTTHNKREIFLALEQVSHLASGAPEAVQAAIWIALLTGCRRGEILKMRPEDIGRDTITIDSGNTRTRRTRVIPIAPGLRQWPKHVPLPYKDYEGLKSGFQRASIKAEMPWVNFHDLRHSCASIPMAKGADLYTVSKILGHSTITTTQRYADLEVSQQRAALKKAFG